MKKITFALSAIFLLYSGASIEALDFYASPGKNGSLDIYLDVDWSYSDYFYSAITSEYKNFIDSREDETSYVSTGGRSLSFEADIIGVKFNTDLFFHNASVSMEIY
jgi:hypothetical protein